MAKRWSKEEIELLTECLSLGNTHREISDFIFEDFGIVRTIGAINTKCNSLRLYSLNKKIKTHEYFIEELSKINNNIHILDKYLGSKIKIKCKCLIDNNIWYSTSNHLLGGQGCPLCYNSNKAKTHEKFVNEIHLLNPKIEVIGRYINTKTKIKCKCLIDDNIWETTPDSLLSGRGCPLCANRNHGGGYQQMTKEQADNLGYPLYLYKVKLQFEDEIFYKFGLTHRKNKQRYNEYKPYKIIEELSWDVYDAWTAICKEKELKSNYKPKHNFGGWTECYTGKETLARNCMFNGSFKLGRNT